MANMAIYNMAYCEEDLFEYLRLSAFKGITVVPHVCNCDGGWGAGFVLPLARHYPEAKRVYKNIFDKSCPNQHINNLSYLGTVLYSGHDNVIIANMIAQTLPKSKSIRPLYYNHLSACMDKVANFIETIRFTNENVRIVCPLFGAGLAGGDWNLIKRLIYDCWVRRDINVTVCCLPGTVPKEK